MGVKLEDLLKEDTGPLLEDKSKKTIKVLGFAIAIVTVLILVLVGVSIKNATETAQIERARQLSTDIDLISAKIQNIYSEYKINGDKSKLIGISQESKDVKPVVLNGEEYKYGYYYVTANQIKQLITTINILNEDYVLNYSTGDVVNLKGAKWNNRVYYSVDDLKAIRDGKTPPSDYTIIISKPEQMQWLSQYPDRYFKLSNDIDMKYYEAGDGWAPIKEFSGSFDGRGYTIKNLKISRTGERYCGLFAQIKSGARINNLKLENVNVSGGEFTGAIAGTCSGIIVNSSVTGKVSSPSSCVGGAFGIFENGTIKNLKVSTEVNGNDNVGGFAGTITSGTIECCSATGKVTGNENVGGFVGRVNPNSNTLISQVYAQNTISSSEKAGGFVGLVEMQNASVFRVENSYTKGEIKFCDSTAGGFVGKIKANTNSKFEFYYLYTTVKTPKTCEVLRGGFAGDITASGGDSVLCYWEKDNIHEYDLESVGKTNNIGLDFEPHTPSDMKDAVIFAEWDLEEIWKFVKNSTPVLRWQ